MKKILVLILLSLALSVSGCQNDTTSDSEINSKASDFELMNLEEKGISLSSFRGKPVFINFWSVT